MVQILPHIPGFGERLVDSLLKAGGNVAEGLQKKFKAQGLQSILKGLQQPGQVDPNAPAQSQMQSQGQPNQTTQMQPGTMRQPNLAETAAIAEGIESLYGKNAADAVLGQLSDQRKFAAKKALQIEQENRADKRTTIAKRTEAMIGSRESINAQRRNLLSARNAVASGDVGAFSRNSFADLFGESGKRFKTASGAQLDSATKHLLFESLGEISAKGTNLWLEKVAKSAAPELGKSEEANETLITIALGNLDIKEKKLDIEQELLTQYDQLGLKPPPNFEKIVDDLLEPYAKKVQDQVSYDTRVLYEKEKGPQYVNNLKPVPKGTPLTLEKRDALIKKHMKDPKKPVSESTPEERQNAKKTALKLGYTIPASDPNQRNEEAIDVP